MNFAEAVAWVEATANSNIYRRTDPWGIYTENPEDALAMAALFAGPLRTPFGEGNTGEYYHYHLDSRDRKLFGKYKHFHVWCGGVIQ